MPPPKQPRLPLPILYHFDDQPYPAPLMVTEAVVQARRNGLLIGIGSTLTLIGGLILMVIIALLCSLLLLWRLNHRLGAAMLPVTSKPPATVVSATVSPPISAPLPTPYPQIRLGQPLANPQIGLQVVVWDIIIEETIVSITLELRNLNPSTPVAYRAADFQLQDTIGTTYFPDPRFKQDTQIQDGLLAVNEVKEGQLHFRVPREHVVATLIWQSADLAKPDRTIQLQ